MAKNNSNFKSPWHSLTFSFNPPFLYWSFVIGNHAGLFFVLKCGESCRHSRIYFYTLEAWEGMKHYSPLRPCQDHFFETLRIPTQFRVCKMDLGSPGSKHGQLLKATCYKSSARFWSSSPQLSDKKQMDFRLFRDYESVIEMCKMTADSIVPAPEEKDKCNR